MTIATLKANDRGRHCRFTKVLAVLMCAALPVPVPAQGPPSLPERPAYAAMLRADHHRDGGAVADALAAYRDALELFDALAREQPDYKADVIARRRAYCRDQVAAMEGRATEVPVTPAAQLALLEKAFGELQAAQTATSTERDALRAERDALRRSRGIAEEARRAMTERATSAEGAAARVSEERDTLRAAVTADAEEQARLSAELETLRGQAARLSELEQGLTAARSEMAQTAAAAQAEIARVAAERDRAAREIESLRAAAVRAAEAERGLKGDLDRTLAEIKDARAAAERFAEEGRRAAEERDRLQQSVAEGLAAVERAAAADRALADLRTRAEQEIQSARTAAERSAGETRELTAEREQLAREVAAQQARAERAVEKERSIASARSDAERELQGLRVELERNLAVAQRIAEDRDALLRLVDRLERQAAELQAANRALAARAGTPATETAPEPAPVTPPVTEPAPGPAPETPPVAIPPGPEVPVAVVEPSAPVETPVDPLAEAEALLTAGDWAGAWGAADAVLRAQPRRADARFVQARAALGRGDLREARRLGDRLVRDDRRSGLYEHFLGVIAEREKDVQTAYRHFNRAAELDGKNAAYQKDLAVAAYAIGRAAEAIAAFEAALAISPDDGRAHFNLAALLIVTNEARLPEARQHYERAVELGEARDETIERRLHP